MLTNTFFSEYKRKLVSADEAVKIVKSGDWVDYVGYQAQAFSLDRALARRKDELNDIKIRSILRMKNIPEVIKVDPEQKHFIYNSWHFSSIERKLADHGACYYAPILLREVSDYYEQYVDVDVAIVVTSPMDRHGFFNFGLQNSFTRAVLEKAKFIIIEVNEAMPRVFGGNEEHIHISEVDYVVEGGSWSIPTTGDTPTTEVDNKIARFIVNELQDGSCIQLGIGGMPNAVGKLIADSDLKDLGVHTEMFCDAYLNMYRAGKITGRKKTIDRGKMTFSFALGSQDLYDFVNENPICASYPASYTNKPHNIAKNDRAVAINNALEIDLFGQVCSESVGTRHISGTGGQVDFCEGAFMSREGKSFICLSSTYTDKKGICNSRIKPVHIPGAIVTTPRTIVMYVVTEYGIVNLKGKSTWERAEALISIAHPNFQDELVKEAEKMKIWRRTNKRN
ncbi:acetyl-CoA hydrolase/transferase family protein [Desulfolucanica intricata]|uniref:acetyl-CoA hydrolase/transferase family protein n=1 Tax=Desulfolucanica intricata TaxID=1285191 RepID=UPI000835B2A1|nr:acetyl-CoA hydrolase/transferase C-terminal domain-containing protein [Desulfolucanica intricata]